MTHDHHIDLWFKDSEYYMEHAHCVLYDPVIIFLDFWGNILVGTSYLLIPLLLLRLILGMWYRLSPPLKGLIVHGSIFVFLCGTTHFVHAWNWYNASYALQSILELATGIVSVWFTFSLFFFIRGRKWESR
jgi:hypothetical protein